MSVRADAKAGTPGRFVDDEVVHSVVDAVLAIDLEDDYWERQGAMLALLLWDHPRGEETVRRWPDRAVATQTSDA